MNEYKHRPWWKPGSGGGAWTRPDETAWHEAEPVESANVSLIPPPPEPLDEDEVVLVTFTYGGITTVRAHYPNRSRRAR